MISKAGIHDIYLGKRDELNLIALSLPLKPNIVKYPTFIEQLYETSSEDEVPKIVEIPEYISNIGLIKLYISFF